MPDSSHPEPTRIERGNYIADVLHHTSAESFWTSAESFWYYVIQRKNSNEVIDLVKFNTYEGAIARAQEVLARLSQAAKSAWPDAESFLMRPASRTK